MNKTLIAILAAGMMTIPALAGCSSSAPTLKQGDCAVIGSDQSIHQVSCNHPPTNDIYYVAQVTSGSCTATAGNEATQNGQTLCLRQIYRGDNTSNITGPPPSTAPTQPPLPEGAKYLGPITQKYMQDSCDGVGRNLILRHSNAYGWVCGQQGTTQDDMSIDMDQVCQYLYGTPTGPLDMPVKDHVYAPDSVAQFRNYSDPNSWGCYGKPSPAP
jgi:hypothetical protein